MVVEGEQVVVGDVDGADRAEVAYEVLCRRHHVRRMTAATARALGPGAQDGLFEAPGTGRPGDA